MSDPPPRGGKLKRLQDRVDADGCASGLGRDRLDEAQHGELRDAVGERVRATVARRAARDVDDAPRNIRVHPVEHRLRQAERGHEVEVELLPQHLVRQFGDRLPGVIATDDVDEHGRGLLKQLS